MLPINNSYHLLGVSSQSSPSEVKTAYLRMARLYHPDKVKQTDSSGPSFISIHNAYEAIQVDMSTRTIKRQ